MGDERLFEKLLAADPFEGLAVAWSSPDLTLAERARAIAALHMRSRMTLEGTARMAGATPAQIQALLDLATLDDETLRMIAEANPPATTWFLFAGADPKTARAGLDALSNPGSSGEPAAVRVYKAMRASYGPSREERIASISGETLGYLAHKAKEYGVLSKTSRKFLVDLAIRKKRACTMTEKQLNYLYSVLLELVENGVVSRTSADDDQEMCNEVLDALGI